MTAATGFYGVYLATMRWVLPVLAVLFCIYWFKTLRARRVKTTVYATLVGEDGTRYPIAFRETSIGRKKTCDIVLDVPTVSRRQAVLCLEDNGGFVLKDIGETGEIKVDGAKLRGEGIVRIGEEISFGGYRTKLVNPVQGDLLSLLPRRGPRKRVEAPGFGLVLLLLTLFQLLICGELCLRYAGPDFSLWVPGAFLVLLAGEWLCYAVTAARGGSMVVETMAFFLTTLGFAVCAVVSTSSLLKELLASVLGFCFFLALSLLLSRVDLAMKLRYPVGIGAVALLILNLVLATVKFGAKNWIKIGPITVQPSEFVKVAFILAGAATLQVLLTRKNFIAFLILSGSCFGCFALMRDFGSAAIFFVTMIVMLYMQTGNLSLIGGILAAAFVAVLGILKFYPYITRRFAAWGHVWQYAADAGFQQTRTMVAIGSGGLLGVGGGNGYLYTVAAADTDLVLGMIWEEWGGVIALCALFVFVSMAIYAIWMCKGVQSTYYSIAICGVMSMMLFQVALNVFGSTDILPLTGVTMPFVSNGGSSIMGSWGMLAFLKAADRQISHKPIPKAAAGPARRRRTSAAWH